jgi:predicted RNA binding protein YcfA (HicA-like mRNA interferase family)
VSPRQPVVNAKQIMNVLNKKGFVLDRQSGSHFIFIKDDLRVTVPFHGKKDIAPGTLRQILNDANISFDELRNLL